MSVETLRDDPLLAALDAVYMTLALLRHMMASDSRSTVDPLDVLAELEDRVGWVIDRWPPSI